MPLDDLYSMTIDVAYRGVPALVLGGSGFIGAWTARALHARGATVTVVARDAEHASAALGPAARDARVIAIDLLRSGALAELMDAVQPTIVFNLVGYGVDQSERDPELMVALNARMVEHLCAVLTARTVVGWAGQRLGSRRTDSALHG